VVVHADDRNEVEKFVEIFRNYRKDIRLFQPDLLDLRADPFEMGPRETIGWGMWSTARMYTLSAAGLIATDFIKTFVDYPPRQAPGSFSVDAIIKQLEVSRSRPGG
jgi:hypothetical protein